MEVNRRESQRSGACWADDRTIVDSCSQRDESNAKAPCRVQRNARLLQPRGLFDSINFVRFHTAVEVQEVALSDPKELRTVCILKG